MRISERYGGLAGNGGSKRAAATRSRVETTMFRLKTILGPCVQSRTWKNQVTELKLKCKILNAMLYLGMPQSYPCA